LLLADEGVLEQLLIGDPPVLPEQRLAHVLLAPPFTRNGTHRSR